METSRTPFRIDRENRKLLGVCAGIADHFGIDVGLVRIGMIVSAAITFPLVVFGYVVVALVADRKSGATPAAPRRRADETRETMRDLDRRLQMLERDVTSSGTRLAREIDALR